MFSFDFALQVCCWQSGSTNSLVHTWPLNGHTRRTCSRLQTFNRTRNNMQHGAPGPRSLHTHFPCMHECAAKMCCRHRRSSMMSRMLVATPWELHTTRQTRQLRSRAAAIRAPAASVSTGANPCRFRALFAHPTCSAPSHDASLVDVPAEITDVSATPICDGDTALPSWQPSMTTPVGPGLPAHHECSLH